VELVTSYLLRIPHQKGGIR